MTVGELEALLSQLPEDAIVKVVDFNGDSVSVDYVVKPFEVGFRFEPEFHIIVDMGL